MFGNVFQHMLLGKRAAEEFHVVEVQLVLGVRVAFVKEIGSPQPNDQVVLVGVVAIAHILVGIQVYIVHICIVCRQCIGDAVV